MEFDKDLAARQEARLLCRQADAAQKRLRQMDQQKLDAITEAIAKAFERHPLNWRRWLFRRLDLEMWRTKW